MEELTEYERWRLVQHDTCPDCGSDLDTGWECNGCGKDWRELALSPAPLEVENG